MLRYRNRAVVSKMAQLENYLFSYSESSNEVVLFLKFEMF